MYILEAELLSPDSVLLKTKTVFGCSVQIEIGLPHPSFTAHLIHSLLPNKHPSIRYLDICVQFLLVQVKYCMRICNPETVNDSVQ